MGTYLAIPGDVDLTGLGLSPQGLMLAKAAQDYGVYVTDTVTNTGCTFYVERAAPTAFRSALLANNAADLKKVAEASARCALRFAPDHPLWDCQCDGHGSGLRGS